MADQVSTLGELRQRYVADGRPMPESVRRLLADDPRAGAAAILRSVARRKKANRAEGQRLRKMLRYERALWDDGVLHIAGIDEAGMSPLAGPVTAAAVILPVGCRIRYVDDSKKLDAKSRDELAIEIKERAVSWAIGETTPAEVDELNIYYAGLLAMRRAVMALKPLPAALLVDARTVPDVPWPQETLIRGDSRSLSIAAASILAKTTRDRKMVAYDRQYPGYGLAQHKGYPVAAHKEALLRLGVTPIHRRSFEAVRLALNIDRTREEV
ncbi:MAG: ribonuclease HII [Myxococcota bacterium]|jgi:ribonuclease HII